jgi:copper chaperone NosL
MDSKALPEVNETPATAEPAGAPVKKSIGDLLRKQVRFLFKPLTLTSRLLLLVAAAAVAASLFFPLWKLVLIAPQYPEGLRLSIYSWKIEGGGLNGNDLNEINNLNHYIGMKTIQQADFTEMQVMPFMFGIFVMLALRAAVLGTMRAIVDLFMLASWFGVFSIGSFYYRLWSYGHNLDPKAPMTIEPFTPLIFGTQQIANFQQSSYPQLGTYLLWVFMALLLAAMWCSRKEEPFARQ